MRVGSSGAARAIRGAMGRATDPTRKRTVRRWRRTKPLSAFVLVCTEQPNATSPPSDMTKLRNHVCAPWSALERDIGHSKRIRLLGRSRVELKRCMRA